MAVESSAQDDQEEPAHTVINHTLLERLHAGDPSLTEISLDQESVKTVNLQNVATALHILSQHVTSIRLMNVGSLGESEAALLGAISHASVLQHLTLQGTCLTASSARLLTLSSSGSNGNGNTSSHKNHTLKSLSLQDNPKLGPRGVKYLAASLQKCKALERLNLRGIAMGHFGAQAVGTALAVCVSLQELDISYNRIGSDGLWKMAGGLSRLTKLQVLKLENNAIQDDGCLELARRLPAMPQLTHLDISNNDIGDVGMTELAQQIQKSLSSIRQLNLAGNRMADAGAVSWAQVLSQMSDLKVLNLSGNQIGDKGASALAEGLVAVEQDEHENDDDDDSDEEDEESVEDATKPSPPVALSVSVTVNGSHLEELNLSGNLIGDEGAGTFVEHLDEIPSLRILDLSDNAAVSEARSRIMHMLLKHRTSVINSPRASTPLPRHSNSLDAAAAVSAIPCAPFTPGHESSEQRPSSPESTNRQEDDEIDPDAVAQGREILQSISLDSEQSGGGGDKISKNNLPADYVAYLTDHHANKAVRCYGAFGPLYVATDESFPGQDLVVRRVTVGRAGAMEAVRKTVWDEILALETPTLLPVLARSQSQSAGSYSLVYDVTGGTTVYDIVKDETKRKALTWKHRIHIVRSVAQALDFLHSGGPDRKPLFHGDVHPSNIYVSSDYATVQLSDAGVSRLVATDREKFRSGDVVFGSRSYRCPRYERGSCAYDASSDMFSLGIILAELMTGQLQRSKSKDSSGMAHDVYFDHIVPQKDISTDSAAGPMPASLHKTLWQILICCMSPIPVQRPTATTVVDVLAELQEN
jgi:Ran GTPase-activating protein (RanGAP) involved in mRNA processing and transport